MKALLALALMLPLLAIGNTAAACPLGVCAGEPIKPNFLDGGWDAYGFGIEKREYKGSLGFDVIYIEGTRKGGACRVKGYGLAENPLRRRLERKYGPPVLHDRSPRTGGSLVVWRLDKNPNKIAEIILDGRLEYRFENYHECEKAKEAAKKAEEAAKKAKSKRKDAEL